MEMNNETKFSCAHGEEMLAYLYDELSPDGRERFETHMESCFECIDEFAELAFSRYSVFEWKSLEFAPLPTPKFVVPVERKPATASWFDGIRAAFAWNGWAVAGGAAAVTLFAVIGIALWNVQPDTTIAVSEPVRSLPAVDSAEPSNRRSVEIAETERAYVEPRVETRQESEPAHRTAPQSERPIVAKAVTVRKAPAERRESRRTTANERLQNSPTLGQYVEDQDESLRLSDIFDDLDSRDLE